MGGILRFVVPELASTRRKRAVSTHLRSIHTRMKRPEREPTRSLTRSAPSANYALRTDRVKRSGRLPQSRPAFNRLTPTPSASWVEWANRARMSPRSRPEDLATDYVNGRGEPNRALGNHGAERLR